MTGSSDEMEDAGPAERGSGAGGSAAGSVQFEPGQQAMVKADARKVTQIESASFNAWTEYAGRVVQVEEIMPDGTIRVSITGGASGSSAAIAYAYYRAEDLILRPIESTLKDFCFTIACDSRWRCRWCVQNNPTSPACSPNMCERCNNAFEKKWQAEQKHAVMLWQMYDKDYHVAAINWVILHVNSEFLPEGQR